MKLDRNINPDGRGKYALINLRAVHAIEASTRFMDQQALRTCLETLESMGVLSYGNESPGDQFFVMKYKDRFTAAGIGAYAVAAARAGMTEYADELFQEEKSAAEIGTRLPD